MAKRLQERDCSSVQGETYRQGTGVRFVEKPLSLPFPESREDYLACFDHVRAATRVLSDPLTPEDMVVQSMPDASPVKWHLAHTSWFFETFVLKPLMADYKPFNSLFEYLFNSYYEQVGPQWLRPDRGLLSRPTCREVMDYRTCVDAAMHRFITGISEKNWEQVRLPCILGLHHEQQHQELVYTDIKHALSKNPLNPALYQAPDTSLTRCAGNGWTGFEGGIYETGHTLDPGTFAFDNEGPRHRVLVPPFALANHTLTNGEYLDFVQDRGYERPELWLSDGWCKVTQEGWKAPLYWRRQEDGTYREFTLHGERNLAPDVPVVHLSFYEAHAYAHWAGLRLPTEVELEVAAREQPVTGHFALKNTEGGVLSAHPRPAQRPGLEDLFGNVWEWTMSAYSPYPGYRVPDGAIGEYNGKFMSGQMVLRGGSCATPEGHMRPSYRNFFPPEARWQFSGLRLAKDLS